MEDKVIEIITDRYTVRVHPGQRSEVERRAAIEKAAQDFFREVIKQKELKRKGVNA